MQLLWLYPAQFYGPFVFDMSVLNYRSGCALVATLKHSQPNIHKQYSQTIKSCLSTLWVNKQESIKNNIILVWIWVDFFEDHDPFSLQQTTSGYSICCFSCPAISSDEREVQPLDLHLSCILICLLGWWGIGMTWNVPSFVQQLWYFEAELNDFGLLTNLWPLLGEY